MQGPCQSGRAEVRALWDIEETAVKNETPILPVALRNSEITEADVLVLAQKAKEILATGKQPAPATKKVRAGKRVRVRR
jgi:hypothetical protein